METKKVLVTGGAGFIGSHIVDALVEKGHDVRILDNLDRQVHPNGEKPAWLNPQAEFLFGDVTKKEDVQKALQDVQVVFHEAAAVGVGQSMYEINYYVRTNNLGTSNLLEAVVNGHYPIEKMVVAASMSSYGEGLYKCGLCGKLFEPTLRSEKQMAEGRWEFKCSACNGKLIAMPTPETKRQNCESVYALTKKDQEEMLLMVGKAYGIPAVALRYFNVFGPRQSLSNPYTGVCAIFMSRVKNGKAPVIYEDGLQTRDFVSVHDVAKANLLAMESSAANYETFNVGGGSALSIRKVAETIISLYGSDLKPEITKKFRKGDIRHCFADISKIRSKLGFRPGVSFEKGMKEIIEWSASVQAEDRFDEAAEELKRKGLA
ncbi:MAG: SDR family NAD(P)-dependent oxidoreductase [Candidatus Diapherotrites archaeon]|nr:SDR family NAD(P)-dependent oxidoreductase [Candidatus Diapherotrites archaeon]